MGFILIIIGALLILLNVKAIKKENNSFASILKKEESTTNRDYDVEIISIRRDLAESILDIQKEMEEIRQSIININNNEGNIKDNKKNIVNYLESIEEKVEEDDIINNSIEYKGEDVISEINFNNKIKKIEKIRKNNNAEKVYEVKKLARNGFSDDEICEKMSIGKGEVLLIKGLFKK